MIKNKLKNGKSLEENNNKTFTLSNFLKKHFSVKKPSKEFEDLTKNEGGLVANSN